MSNTNNNESSRRRRLNSVRFAENSISPLSSPLQQLQSTTEWESLWYSSAELQIFRDEARNICRLLRRNLQHRDQNTGDSEASSSDDDSDHEEPVLVTKQPSLSLCSQTRGLEPRFCMERQRRKYVACKYILKVASKLQSSTDHTEKLAAVAQRCNAWASALAVEEASRDFFSAYSEELLQLQSCVKRNLEDQSNTLRNVRTRYAQESQ